MADLDINITLSGGAGDGGGGEAAQVAGNNTDVAQSNAKTAFTVSQAMRVAQRLGTQVATNLIGSIGTFSGNNVLQTRVENGLAFGQKIVGIGISFIANPVLGAVALTGEAINAGFQIAKMERQRLWQNTEAAELRRRAGYLSDANRGRQ